MEVFVNRVEMARQLDIPAATIDYLRRKKGLPSVKVGKHYRYVPSDVAYWLKSGNEGSVTLKEQKGGK